MWLKSVTFLVWAAVAASSVFWSLKLFAQPAGEAAQVPTAAPAAVPPGDWGKVLGRPTSPVAPAAPVLASRLKLIGLAGAAREGSGVGVALITLDDKPAKAYSVGAVVEGEMVVQDIAGQTVRIGPRNGAPLITLQAPLLPAAATSDTPPYAALPVPSPAPVAAPAVPAAAPAAPAASARKVPKPPPAPTPQRAVPVTAPSAAAAQAPGLPPTPVVPRPPTDAGTTATAGSTAATVPVVPVVPVLPSAAAAVR